MAEHPGARRTTDVFFDLQDAGEHPTPKAVLDHKKMSSGSEKSVSCMGIQGWKALLVYQRHHL
jgi:hypothetical protein